jgi:hypothetical protein
LEEDQSPELSPLGEDIVTLSEKDMGNIFQPILTEDERSFIQDYCILASYPSKRTEGLELTGRKR